MKSQSQIKIEILKKKLEETTGKKVFLKENYTSQIIGSAIDSLKVFLVNIEHMVPHISKTSLEQDIIEIKPKLENLLTNLKKEFNQEFYKKR